MSHTEIVILQFKGGIILAIGEVDPIYRAQRKEYFLIVHDIA